MNMNKMISSKQYFQSDCFSGECGLCFNCNKNSSMDLNRKLNESDMLSGLSMSVRRSRDLLKYLGKKKYR